MNGYHATAVITATPISAAKNRGVEYDSVFGDYIDYELGETLCRKPDGGLALKAKEDDSDENSVPVFTINVGTGTIKTATDFGESAKSTVHVSDWTLTLPVLDSLPVRFFQATPLYLLGGRVGWRWDMWFVL